MGDAISRSPRNGNIKSDSEINEVNPERAVIFVVTMKIKSTGTLLD